MAQYVRRHISVSYMTVTFCGGFDERIEQHVSVTGDPKRKNSLLEQKLVLAGYPDYIEKCDRQ